MNLPCDECRGQCCTMVAMSTREFKTIRKKYGIPKGAIVDKIEMVSHASYQQKHLMTVNMANGNCAYLVDGMCSVYADRPKVCQEYGIHPKLPCQYLYPDKAKREIDTMNGDIARLVARGMKL